jgi:hypothetical protein
MVKLIELHRKDFYIQVVGEHIIKYRVLHYSE